MRERIRFGLLGCGMVSQFHCDALIHSDEAELAAVADVVEDRAREVAEKYYCEAVSVDELFERDDIDVINVLTPNATHADNAIRVAQAGKHCVVEKPPDMKLSQVDAMAAAFAAAGRKLAICLNVRFRPAIEAMKQACETGRFGKILQGDAYVKWYRPADYYQRAPWLQDRSQGAGVTIQQGIHYIDLLQHLVGPVARVWAEMTNVAHRDVPTVEDTLLATLHFEKGARGVVQASTAFYPGTDIRIEINGTQGTAVMVGERLEMWDFEHEQPGDQEARRIGSAAALTGAGGAADIGYMEHQRVMEDMVAAIREDREPRVTAQSARHTLEIALAMYKSADSGEEVALPLDPSFEL